MVRLVISSWGSLTGGGDGLNLPLLERRPQCRGPDLPAVMILIMLAAFLMTVAVDRGRLGFGLRCIQQNEDAANMVGVNVTRLQDDRLSRCRRCSAEPSVHPTPRGRAISIRRESFSILMSIKVPVMCLLGGPGTVLGAVIGTAAFTLLEEIFWANFLDYNRAILGAVIVILIFFLPGGLLAMSYRDVVARLAGLSAGTKAAA